MMNDIRYRNCLRRVSGNRPRLRGDRLSSNGSPVEGIFDAVESCWAFARTRESRGGKLDSQLRIAPAGSNPFVHRHPLPRMVLTILGSATFHEYRMLIG